jgi:hypothetical protein
MRAIVMVGFVALVLGFGSGVAFRLVHPRQSQQITLPDPRFVYKIELGDARRRGPEDALVTVVAFARAPGEPWLTVEKAVLELARERPGKVRLVLKDLETHRDQAERFGIARAPAVFVNGRFVPEPDVASLRRAIDEAARFAEQLVREGTPRERVYESLMRGALADTGPIT